MQSPTDRFAVPTVFHRPIRFLLDHAREFAGLTAALTFLLVLVGEFTAAAGAGATCNFTYPGCAGQLSPIGLTIPQFIEWFHRFFAMLVGIVILVNSLVLWYRYTGTRISWAGWLATLLLPIQVFLGGVTVTFATLFPEGYTPAVQLTHLATALALFLSLVAAFAWIDLRENNGASPNRLYLLGLIGVGLTGLQTVFAPGLVYTFWPSVQMGYHFFGHLVVATFLVSTLFARSLDLVDAGIVGGIGTVLGLANTFLVIGLFLVSEGVRVMVYLLLFVQLFLFAWLVVIGSRADTGSETVGREAATRP
ncbi:MAG: COX15/CtaA family protein [Halodesulfurarchaeum sp.]|nr:COX15/CtaA family protein [Halodesulfurarchaeum sp.]